MNIAQKMMIKALIPYVKPLMSLIFTKGREAAKSLPTVPTGCKRMLAAIQLTEITIDEPQFLFLVQDINEKTGEVINVHFNRVIKLNPDELTELIKETVEKL